MPSQLVYQIITTYLPLTISALFFFLAWFCYFWRGRYLDKVLQWGIGLLGLMYLVKAYYVAWLQYLVWQMDAMGRFFLPPHTSINYFWHYVWVHFLLETMMILVGAIFLGGVIWLMNLFLKRKNNLDIKLAIFGGLIAGWPKMLIFFFFTLILSLLTLLFYGIIYKQSKSQISLTPFFFISIIVVILLGKYLEMMLNLNQFAI